MKNISTAFSNTVLRTATLALLLFFTVQFHSCKDQGVDSSYSFALPHAGVYNYSGYDSLGTQIVQGKIRFYYSDSIRIRGTWSLTTVGNPSAIGPQIGSDTLFGSYTKSRFGIDLNPQMRDDNVDISIYGQINSQTFTGKWVWSTYRGITNYGKSQFVVDTIY